MQPPTVNEVLSETHTGYGTLHNWPTEGGWIAVTEAQLRPVLETAYDPNMTNWLSLISWDDTDGFFVA